MTDVKAKIREASNSTSATVSTTEDSVSTRTQTAFIIAKRLEEFTNINTVNLGDGSVLVYNENTEEWTSTTQLDQQTVDAGEF